MRRERRIRWRGSCGVRPIQRGGCGGSQTTHRDGPADDGRTARQCLARPGTSQAAPGRCRGSADGARWVPRRVCQQDGRECSGPWGKSTGLLAVHGAPQQRDRRASYALGAAQLGRRTVAATLAGGAEGGGCNREGDRSIAHAGRAGPGSSRAAPLGRSRPFATFEVRCRRGLSHHGCCDARASDLFCGRAKWPENGRFEGKPCGQLVLRSFDAPSARSGGSARPTTD